ncbi:MBL fold metallo-hydrolase [Aquabacterium sp. OR-4]|uniref:MBL fold metallo-hydrolase n=1 Tax=Aquabacterium sp. OR-4 TaxID=2978127 RepID=UPI0021B4AB92|nr:MBL fold metallo-hydrolase [Aquabacterium sp. OR-4]MDT7838302.1 MBL fold metallo-hydrolase [Aquabacterium sp. OR-4]
MTPAAAGPDPARRRLALGGLAGLGLAGGLCLATGGCALRSALPPPAAPPVAAGAAPMLAPGPPVQLQAVAPGVYMARGQPGVADAANLGRIGNAGVIVGPRGVVCIDTGSSRQHGEALLAAVAELTDQPVRLALLTQVRPEFVFGAAAFQARGIALLMHQRGANLMAARCETCLRQLRQQVGEAPLQGTVLARPDQVFSDGQLLQLIGRPLQLLYPGPAGTPGDIAVFDTHTGSLFAGGLVSVGRIPDIQDSDWAGWHAALAALARLPVRQLVPGHGPAAGPQAIAQTDRYLTQLARRARALVAEGSALMNIGEALELPEFAAWDQYETTHRRNASIAYLRVEREALLQ